MQNTDTIETRIDDTNGHTYFYDTKTGLSAWSREELLPLMVATATAEKFASTFSSTHHHLGKTPLHLAAASAHLHMVQRLLEQPTVDAGAVDLAGRSPLDDVEAMLQQNTGNAERLKSVRNVLMEADLTKQMQRQVQDGVKREEGQRVRNYLQSLVRGPIGEFMPKVMISYATGMRKGLDGEGCGLGMQYCHLVARYLDRAGISCFTGLHVAGGYNWRMYFEKLKQADVMLAIMSPGFFKSGPCFEEQVEARRHGLKVIPLIFELNEDGSPPGSDGAAAWVSKYEARQSEASTVHHDTLAAFRIIDSHSDKYKLNSEPAPPGTMLDPGLLEKLVGTVKKLIAQSGAKASSATLMKQLSQKDNEIEQLKVKQPHVRKAAGKWRTLARSKSAESNEGATKPTAAWRTAVRRASLTQSLRRGSSTGMLSTGVPSTELDEPGAGAGGGTGAESTDTAAAGRVAARRMSRRASVLNAMARQQQNAAEKGAGQTSASGLSLVQENASLKNELEEARARLAALERAAARLVEPATQLAGLLKKDDEPCLDFGDVYGKGAEEDFGEEY